MSDETRTHIGYENGCFCHRCCVRDNTPPDDASSEESK